MQRGEFAEAERLLRQVETTHPPYTDRVRFNLAGVLAMQGRNQEAEAIFGQVIEAGDPEEAPGAMTQLAALYFRTGRFDESERLYRQAWPPGTRSSPPGPRPAWTTSSAAAAPGAVALRPGGGRTSRAPWRRPGWPRPGCSGGRCR